MKNRRAGSVFVNRRYVRSTSLHDMVKNAYGAVLVKGEFPFFVLNIDLPTASVDVNVHPNKLQVRFKDAAAVEYVIKEAVSKACNDIYGTIPLDMPERPILKRRSSIEMHAPSGGVQEEFFSGFTSPVLKEDVRSVEKEGRVFNFDENESAASDDVYLPDYADSTKDNTMPEPLPAGIDYRLIGSFGNTYILIEQGERLLILDQHAAHERILYDKFTQSHTAASQRLLAPYVLTVSHEQKNQIDDNIEVFLSLGFEVEPFGVLEYKISAVPSVFYSASPDELVMDALNEISQSDDIVLKRERIIKAACRSAVKAGDKLGDEELLSLVEVFLRTNIMPTCPHGRPVISAITKAQVEKSFKRRI